MSLKNLPKLVFFDATNNQLTDLIIDSFLMITDFYASNNSFASLSFLEALNVNKLTKLYIDNNNFPSCDLSVFNKFKNLKSLRLSSNCFYGDLQPLNSLSKLEELGVSDTKTSDDFEHLPNSLKEFWYSGDKKGNAKRNLFANEKGVVEKSGRGSIKDFSRKLYDYKQ